MIYSFIHLFIQSSSIRNECWNFLKTDLHTDQPTNRLTDTSSPICFSLRRSIKRSYLYLKNVQIASPSKKSKKLKIGLKNNFLKKVKALCYSNVGSIFHIYFLKIEKCNFLIFFFLRTLSTKMVRQGPQMVRLVHFFFLRLATIDKLEFTAYSQLHFPFRSYRNNMISKPYGRITPPPSNEGLTGAI